MDFIAGLQLLHSLSNVVVDEDFINGNNSSGLIGSSGWVAAGTITLPGAEANAPGIYRFSTGASSGTVARLSMPTSVAFLPSNNHLLLWRYRLNTNDANTTTRIGAANSVAGAPPSNGIYFEKLDGDSNWFCVTRAGGSQTRTDSGVAVDTGFHRFKYIRTTAGVVFVIDDVPVVTHTATIPSVAIAQYCYIINSTTEDKSFDVNKAQFLLTGLVR